MVSSCLGWYFSHGADSFTDTNRQRRDDYSKAVPGSDDLAQGLRDTRV